MTPSASPTGNTARATSRWRRIRGSFWFNLLAAVLVLTLVQSFVVKLYYVPSSSMSQTLEVGDRILVDRLGYAFSDPRPGDVVVFQASEAWEPAPATSANPLVHAVRWLGGLIGIGPNLDHTLVKRIIAGPGQKVECCGVDGAVTVDGKALDEPYVFEDLPFVPGTLDCSSTPASLRCFDEVTVPKDQYLVMGDHRSNSSDSVFACRGTTGDDSCFKFATRADIVGRVFLIALPIGRWGGL